MIPKLNQTESTKVTNIVRTNKFQNFDNIIFYVDIKESFIYFTNCYKLLELIIINLQKDDEDLLKNKLQGCYDELKDLNKIIAEFLFKIGKSINKYAINKKMDKLYLENQEKIDSLICFIYAFGKVIKQFDPDESQGFY